MFALPRPAGDSGVVAVLGLLLLVLLAAWPARCQAPGDASQFCLSHWAGRRYEDHIQPLMDSRDYGNPNEIWQTLNLDEHESGTGHSEWLFRGGRCERWSYVCGKKQNNWIVTQFINRTLNSTTEIKLPSVRLFVDINSTNNQSSSENVQQLSVYILETSAVDATLARDTSRYRFVANVSSKAGEIAVHLESQETGFYVGIRDNGTCITLKKVVVYYTSCPPETLGLVSMADSNKENEEGVEEEKRCGLYSVPVSRLVLGCLRDGEWSVVRGCQCATGYRMDLTHQCQKCSEIESGGDSVLVNMTGCFCVQHYFGDHSRQAPPICAGSQPFAPQYITVSTLTNTSITLTWLPPLSIGNRSDDIYTYTVYIQDSTSQTVMIAKAGVKGTGTELSGLTPFLGYLVYVHAENENSNVVPYHLNITDHDIRHRTAAIAATTLEGVGAQVTEVTLIGRDTLQWSEPNPPHGIIWSYNLKITGENGATVPGIDEYTGGTTISHDYWTEQLGLSDGVYKVQIQAVTDIGPGNFSHPIHIFVYGDENTTRISTLWFVLAGGFVLFSIIVVLILIFVVCVSKNFYGTRKQKTLSQLHASEEVKREEGNIEAYATCKRRSTVEEEVYIQSPDFSPPIPNSPRPLLSDSPSNNNSQSSSHKIKPKSQPPPNTAHSAEYAVLEETTTSNNNSRSNPLNNNLQPRSNLPLPTRHGNGRGAGHTYDQWPSPGMGKSASGSRNKQTAAASKIDYIDGCGKAAMLDPQYHVLEAPPPHYHVLEAPSESTLMQQRAGKEKKQH